MTPPPMPTQQFTERVLGAQERIAEIRIRALESVQSIRRRMADNIAKKHEEMPR